MNEVFLDIETIKCQREEPLREFLTRTIKPPKTISLPSSIEAWHKDKKAGVVQEAIDATGLDGAFGTVCCIGYQLPGMKQPESICGMDEPFVLREFNAALDSIPANMESATTVVGHNLVGFDLRFLLQRYIVNSIRPHAIINMAAKAKAWDNSVYDTMLQFAGYGNRISLDKLCFALGLEGKSDFTWEDVLPAMLCGSYDSVAEYCQHDVSITRAVYMRMTFKELQAA